jgi:hypothetical protein
LRPTVAVTVTACDTVTTSHSSTVAELAVCPLLMRLL